MQRTFVYKDEKSNKFWSIDVDGSSYTVTYGKVGTDGQTSEKTFETAEACRKAADKVIAEKTGKGYIEEGGGSEEEEADETVEVNVLPPQITKLRELKTYKIPTRTVTIRTLGDTAIFLTDAQKKGDKTFYELIFCGVDGIRASVRHHVDVYISIPRVVDGHVYVSVNDSVFKYDAAGKEVAKFTLPGENIRKVVVGRGDAIYAYDESKVRRIRDGKAETVAKLDTPITFLTTLDTGDIALLLLKDDVYKIAILDPDGNEKWRTKLKGGKAWLPQPASDGRLFCQANGALNLVDPAAKTCHSKSVSVKMVGKAPVEIGEFVAYVSTDDTVEILTWHAKHVATILRTDKDETKGNVLPVAAGAASLFVPGAGNKVYRVAADGSCTGLVELPNPIGEQKYVAALPDGTMVISDSENEIHFVPDNAFKPADLPKGPEFLVEDAKRLEKHFAPWAVTPACKGIVKDLLARLIGVDEKPDGSMTLTFQQAVGTYRAEECVVKFDAPAPGKMPENMPPSFHKAAELHGGVSYDNGNAAGFQWSYEYMNDCDFDYWDEMGAEEDDRERYSAIAYAGQNWYFIDRKKKNKLGEPRFVLLSHECSFDETETFNGDLQKKTAYGLPGFTWRVLAYEILDEEDPRFKGCCMG